jgi:hypothetical protein
MRQVEVATTITFTAPRHARAFFEALAADNLDIGRPDNMEIIFNRQVRCVTKGVFRTAVDRDNDGVVINAFYRHSRIKTYQDRCRSARTRDVEEGNDVPVVPWVTSSRFGTPGQPAPVRPPGAGRRPHRPIDRRAGPGRRQGDHRGGRTDCR